MATASDWDGIAIANRMGVLRRKDMNGIRRFPQFSPLTRHRRKAVADHTRNCAPYSDFNFVSLLTWDTNDEAALSWLSGNLVVRFADYCTQEPFYSFLGSNDLEATGRTLLEFIKTHSVRPSLYLVPECVAEPLAPCGLHIHRDDDQRDYLLAIEALRTYAGNRLGAKRNFVIRFHRAHQAQCKAIDLTEVGIQTRVLDLVHRRQILQVEEEGDPDHERTALHRAMTAYRYLPTMRAYAVFVGSDMAAFVIAEVLRDGYAKLHFTKADTDYVGIYPYLMQKLAQELAATGAHTLNYQQDLGVPGLRRGKQSYAPIGFLGKYTVSDCPDKLQARATKPGLGETTRAGMVFRAARLDLPPLAPRRQEAPDADPNNEH